MNLIFCHSKKSAKIAENARFPNFGSISTHRKYFFLQKKNSLSFYISKTIEKHWDIWFWELLQFSTLPTVHWKYTTVQEWWRRGGGQNHLRLTNLLRLTGCKVNFFHRSLHLRLCPIITKSSNRRSKSFLDPIPRCFSFWWCTLYISKWESVCPILRRGAGQPTHIVHRRGSTAPHVHMCPCLLWIPISFPYPDAPVGV